MTVGHTSSKRDKALANYLIPNTFSLFEKFTKEESYLIKYIKGKLYLFVNFKDGNYLVSNSNTINLTTSEKNFEKLNFSLTINDKDEEMQVDDNELKSSDKKIPGLSSSIKRDDLNGKINTSNSIFPITENNFYKTLFYPRKNWLNEKRKSQQKFKLSINCKKLDKSKFTYKINESISDGKTDSYSMKNATKWELSKEGGIFERNFIYFGKVFNINGNNEELKKDFKFDLGFVGFYGWKERSTLGRGWKVKSSLSHKFNPFLIELKA